MTLVQALETLKANGITRLTGLHSADNEDNIDHYLNNARQHDEDAIRYSDQDWAQYHMEHADSHYIIEIEGYHIIATHYDKFDMVTYSNYETEDAARSAFDEWKTIQDANIIADEKIAEGSEFPREFWVLFAASELRAEKKAAMIAFEREYGNATSE